MKLGSMSSRILSVLIILLMVFSLSISLISCSSKTESGHAVTYLFPEVDAARYGAETGVALATDLYIYARMKTEELIEYDLG